MDCVATNCLYFIISSGVLIAVHRWGRRKPKLLTGLEDERAAFTPVSAEGQRELANGILAPMARLITGEIVDADVRFRHFGAVTLTFGEKCRSHAVTEIGSMCPLFSIML